jgi:hypothetical protein
LADLQHGSVDDSAVANGTPPTPPGGTTPPPVASAASVAAVGAVPPVTSLSIDTGLGADKAAQGPDWMLIGFGVMGLLAALGGLVLLGRRRRA